MVRKFNESYYKFEKKNQLQVFTVIDKKNNVNLIVTQKKNTCNLILYTTFFKPIKAYIILS